MYSTKEKANLVQLIESGEMGESDWEMYMQNHTSEMSN